MSTGLAYPQASRSARLYTVSIEPYRSMLSAPTRTLPHARHTLVLSAPLPHQPSRPPRMSTATPATPRALARLAWGSKDLRLVALLTGLALVLRLGFVLAVERQGFALNDTYFYFLTARSLSDDGGFTFV